MTALLFSEILTLDPVKGTGSGGSDGQRMFAVYGALMTLDGNTGEMKYVQAESFKLKSPTDASVWVLKLRPGMKFSDGTVFDARFTALGPAAAEVLVRAGVRLVGIDTPSMDHATSKDLPAHHVLLRGGVALLENLDLSRVTPGDYELIALPLRIVGGDSSPVRAVLRDLPR